VLTIFVCALFVSELQDLIVGWDGSPLAQIAKQECVRTIPFPTRRATLKEANRVYEELMTAIVSTTSSRTSKRVEQGSSTKISAKIKEVGQYSGKSSHISTQPKERGTAHLKKRPDKPEQNDNEFPLAPDDNIEQLSEDAKQDDLPPIDDARMTLVRACVNGDLDYMKRVLDDGEGVLPSIEKTCTFHKGYFDDFEQLVGTAETLGLVGIASVTASMPSLTWLLDNGVSPCIGASPYLSTKSKAARNLLRRYWSMHPLMYDYAAAGIPSPMTDEDVAREAEKKRRERMKKRDKKDQKAEATKTPEVRAREARAVAAELRILGNRCAQCKKSLEGMVPFERLSFKYCSTDCVSKHRTALADTSRR
jgi:hypothetical protein